jgi:hypothetical protein
VNHNKIDLKTPRDSTKQKPALMAGLPNTITYSGTGQTAFAEPDFGYYADVGARWA